MRVRCGACRTQFEVPGAGRFACPVCGSVNVVRDAAGADAPSTIGGYPAATGMPGQTPGAPPPPPSLPRIECPECGFSFVVGPIATATCPMCSAEVPTGYEDESE
jgi:LSD1 subclass zinc finger protein